MPNKKTAATRVVGYVRLSDASKEESTSMARQNEIIRRTAKERGYALVSIVPDEDVSASKKRLDRPGLTVVRRMLREGQADAVLVWRLDRLARSVGDIATLMDEGVIPISCTEPIDASSAMGRAMVEISQVFAGLEARAISERVTASISYLKREGRWSGGSTPYGYMSAPNPNGNGRILVPNPEEQEVVREAAQRVLDGETPYAIARDFTKRGTPSRRGTYQGWLPRSISRILTGDAIVGRLTHHGDVIRDDNGLPKQVWEPVLDPAIWHRVRDRLGVDKPTGERPFQRRRAAHLLSGLIRCAECGHAMYAKTGSKGSSPMSYACASHYRGRQCPGNSISAERIEQHIESVFLAAVGDTEVMIRIQECSVSEADLANVEATIRQTAAAMAADDADVVTLSERLSLLKARRTELRAAPSSPVVRLVGTGETIREVWERAELPQRRDLLAANVAVLSIRKATYHGKHRGTAPVAPERVIFVAQPPVPGEHVPAEGYSKGRVVA